MIKPGRTMAAQFWKPSSARQGESTGRMRIVLLASLILAILVIGGITAWWILSHRTDRPSESTSAASVGSIGPAPNATPTPVSPSRPGSP